MSDEEKFYRFVQDGYGDTWYMIPADMVHEFRELDKKCRKAHRKVDYGKDTEKQKKIREESNRLDKKFDEKFDEYRGKGPHHYKFKNTAKI